MKNYLRFCLMLVSFSLFSQNPSVYANEINADELKKKLYTYASDEFQGRETGTEGQKIAVEYLKQKYQTLGIGSAKANGDYFQNVPLKLVKTPKVTISIGSQSFSYYDDFVAVSSGETAIIEAEEFVFVGYGIKNSLYNDYKDLDVAGKIVVAIAGEPKDKNGNYIVSGTNEISKWSNGRQSLSSKRNLAKELGAKAFLLIDNAMFKRYSSYYKAIEKRGGESNLALDVDDNSF